MNYFVRPAEICLKRWYNNILYFIDSELFLLLLYGLMLFTFSYWMVLCSSLFLIKSIMLHIKLSETLLKYSSIWIQIEFFLRNKEIYTFFDWMNSINSMNSINVDWKIWDLSLDSIGFLIGQSILIYQK